MAKGMLQGFGGTKRIMNSAKKTIALAACACLIVAFGASARDHNMFNGTWMLVSARSSAAAQPVPQSGTVTISDHEGNTSVTRNFVYEGEGQTYFYSDSVGSEHNATIHEGKDFKSKTTWAQDTLRIITSRPDGVTVETYTLESDGTMIATVTRPDYPPFTLVFERKL
jgi:hypothetical protein